MFQNLYKNICTIIKKSRERIINNNSVHNC